MITAQQRNEVQPIALVAGGAGFLGSFLCEVLLFQGCQVICLDDLSTGKKQNLKNCLSSKDFTFYQHDLKKPLSGKILSYFQKDAGLQDVVTAKYIFHLTGLKRVTENLFVLAKQIRTKMLEVRGLEEKGSLSSGRINVKTVYVTDVYGPRMNLDDKSLLVQLIKAAVFGFPLKIPGIGKEELQLTFVSDVVYGLTKAMFVESAESEPFYLISQEKVSVLDFAHQLQKQSQRELKIEYVASEKEKRIYPIKAVAESQKKLNWKGKTDLKEGIRQTLKFFESKSEKKFPQTSDYLTTVKTVKKSSRRFSFSLLVGLLIFFLLFSPLTLLFDSFWGWFNFKKAYQFFLEADFSQGQKKAQQAFTSFKRAEQTVQEYAPVFSFFGQENLAFSAERLFYLGAAASEGLVHTGLAVEKINQLGKVIFQNNSGKVNDLVTETIREIDYSYRQFSLIEADFKTQKLLFQPTELASALPYARQLISQAEKGIRLIPELIGVNGKRTYLVLLQNNSELRPTGGFIGSFALIEFDQGRLLNFEVRDVYSADGQLKGHVEPPAALKKYLGEAGWFLRDSNWDPHFPASARRAGWFLEKETGEVVDGVFGVNLFLAQRILNAVGEIEVIDFGEKINAKNLFEKAGYHSEIGFFPGSTQKQDFLGSLSKSLFEELKNLDAKTEVKILKEVYHSLEAKDLLVFFNNPKAMAVVADLGWDGRIKGVTCQSSSESCFLDYLMLVESNLGVNKANFFVQRDVVHQVNFFSDGQVEEKLKIDYHNSSLTENFPAGRYKNYLRILIPLGSRLGSVLINGQKIDEEKIDQGSLYGKTYFGFLVEVPIKDSSSVEVTYFLPEKISLKGASRYLLLIQKQPGIQDKQISLDLKTSPEITVLPAASFRLAFDKDIVIEATLVK